jgi:hypothetical protein
MGLITETNQQYYAGSQGFRGDATDTANQKFTTTFDTDLVLGSSTSWNPTDADYVLNNFKLYTSATGFAGTWVEWTTELKVSNNIIELVASPGANVYIAVQLKSLTGGLYGQTDNEKAFGQAVEDNYGEYSYVKLGDIIDNYMVGYVGDGKLIQTAKKSDILFFAKRSLQEFSYDTLKSIKSSELTIPDSLSLTIPQDYVNYVSICYIDGFGVKRPLYPNNNLTTNPYNTFLQDSAGQPTQDSHGENTEGTSITEERWGQANTQLINGTWYQNWDNFGYAWDNYGINGPFNWGRLYGLDPQYSQANGWFGINEREGRFTFSSNCVGKLVVIEYISDGLAYDLDTKVPKMAEEAMYRSISYYLLSTRAGVQEYVVQRYRKDKSAALRNAKIRLSNIKLDEIVQVMRGKSKWIKH